MPEESRMLVVFGLLIMLSPLCERSKEMSTGNAETSTGALMSSDGSCLAGWAIKPSVAIFFSASLFGSHPDWAVDVLVLVLDGSSSGGTLQVQSPAWEGR
jgi:hypothetical protein